MNHQGSKTHSESKAEQFAAALADALRTAASHQSGHTWESRLTLTGGVETRSSPGVLAVAMRLRGELDGEITLCLPESSSEDLLRQEDGAAPSNSRTAWLGLVEATIDHIEAGFASGIGAVQIDNCRLVSPAASATSLAELNFEAGPSRNSVVSLLIDKELRSSLEKIAAVAVHPGVQADTPANKVKLHRVIDVPLAVTLRFGQRQLTLRELLELTTGSLLELDRQVEEPVELMLGERVVARGDVVIVDGNYGLRVTEVIENAANRLQMATAV